MSVVVPAPTRRVTRREATEHRRRHRWRNRLARRPHKRRSRRPWPRGRPTLLSIGAVGLMLAVGRTPKLLTFTTTYFQADVVIPYIIATAYRDEAGSGWYIRADTDNSGGILGRRAAMNLR
jgi:hypothetical protein